MKTPTIHVQDNGPYQVKGSFEIMDAKGNTFHAEDDISLCRCGRSGNKPFCDGTHMEIDFESEPRAEDHVIKA